MPASYFGMPMCVYTLLICPERRHAQVPLPLMDPGEAAATATSQGSPFLVSMVGVVEGAYPSQDCVYSRRHTCTTCGACVDVPEGAAGSRHPCCMLPAINTTEEDLSSRCARA